MEMTNEDRRNFLNGLIDNYEAIQGLCDKYDFHNGFNLDLILTGKDFDFGVEETRAFAKAVGGDLHELAYTSSDGVHHESAWFMYRGFRIGGHTKYDS